MRGSRANRQSNSLLASRSSFLIPHRVVMGKFPSAARPRTRRNKNTLSSPMNRTRSTLGAGLPASPSTRPRVSRMLVIQLAGWRPSVRMSAGSGDPRTARQASPLELVVGKETYEPASLSALARFSYWLANSLRPISDSALAAARKAFAMVSSLRVARRNESNAFWYSSSLRWAIPRL